MRSIKRSVITDEISQDIAAAADLAAEFRLDALEIRSVFGAGPHELDAAQRQVIKEETARRGLHICAVAGPVFKCSLFSQEEIEKNFAMLRDCIRAAKDFDCGIVRVFSFWREKISLQEALPRIAGHLGEAARIAADSGITLALENDPTLFAPNAASLAAIIDAVDSPSLRALWDPGNNLYDPFREEPFPMGYDLLKGRIAHMHLKDAVRPENGEAECVAIGTGSTKWPEHWAALIKDGYDGYCSLETHYRHARPMDEALLRLPGGHAFSDGAYEATRECLELWSGWER